MGEVIKENISGFDDIKNNKINPCILQCTFQRLVTVIVGKTKQKWPGASWRTWK